MSERKTMKTLYDNVKKAAELVRKKSDCVPEAGVILASFNAG